MANAPKCQSIADAVSALQNQEQAQLATIAGLTGTDKWNAMVVLGTIRQQISQQQASLDQCNQQNPADLTINVDVTDVPGTTGPDRIARVWKIASGQQTVQQTATIAEGSVTFPGVLGPSRQSFGVTIEGTDDPAVNGPDFRSGPLPPAPTPPADDPAGQVEIVVLSPFDITPEVLAHAAPPLPIQGSLGGISFSVTTLQFTVANGAIGLAAGGNASGLGANSTFTFQSTVQIAPSYSMSPSEILEISPSTSPKLTMSGQVGSILQALASTISNIVDTSALQQLGVILNNVIANQVASGLGLSALPSGCVLSVRQLQADAAGLSVTPVLGAFGTVLSDFQPAPNLAVAKLTGLTVQPTSISTGDPTNLAAQGTVTLNGPAPANGASVQVSVDRPDLVGISPASVVIAAGKTSGTFVASGILQSLTSSGTVDATITASLGDQSLTASLAVRPETPATPPANVGTTTTGLGTTSSSAPSSGTQAAGSPGLQQSGGAGVQTKGGSTGGGGVTVSPSGCPCPPAGQIIVNIGSGSVSVDDDALDASAAAKSPTSTNPIS
jgi:hypothetical protein